MLALLAVLLFAGHATHALLLVVSLYVPRGQSTQPAALLPPYPSLQRHCAKSAAPVALAVTLLSGHAAQLADPRSGLNVSCSHAVYRNSARVCSAIAVRN